MSQGRSFNLEKNKRYLVKEGIFTTLLHHIFYSYQTTTTTAQNGVVKW